MTLDFEAATAAGPIRLVLPEPPREDKVVPEQMALDIRYEDDQLLVVNKPAGMVVPPNRTSSASSRTTASSPRK